MPNDLEKRLRAALAQQAPKPWEVPISGVQVPQPRPIQAPIQAAPVGSIADDPMALAAKRQQLMEGLAPYGQMANPEKPGTSPGLLQLIMSLFGSK